MSHVDPSNGAEVVRLLLSLRDSRTRVPEELIRLHETALFFRAYPHDRRVLRLADEILFRFADRVRGVSHETLEDPELSGIAGTAVSTNYSYEFARRLVNRYGKAIQV